MDTMKVAQRLITGVFGLVISGLGLVLLVMAMQRPAPKWVVDFTAQEVVWIGFGAAITGLAFVWLATTEFQRFDDRIVIQAHNGVHRSDSTRVTVSQNSMDEILHYVTLDNASIRGCKSRVRLENGCWKIHCDLWVSPMASIPALSQELETEIRQTMMHHTGIPVGQLDFNVAITSNTKAL